MVVGMYARACVCVCVGMHSHGRMHRSERASGFLCHCLSYSLETESFTKLVHADFQPRRQLVSASDSRPSPSAGIRTWVRTLSCNRKWTVLRYVVEGPFPRHLLSVQLPLFCFRVSVLPHQNLAKLNTTLPSADDWHLTEWVFNRSCERHIIPSDGHPSPSATTFGPLYDVSTQWVNFT